MSLLQQAITAHQLRAVSRVVVRPGGEAIAQRVQASSEDLMLTVGGTVYDVFVLGQSAPDEMRGAVSRYYIP